MLQAESLSCYRQERWLFRNLDFHVLPGKVLQITGDNGSGKSTLFRVLAGLSDDYDGQIDWQVPSCVFLSHRFGLNARLTAFENLTFWLTLQGESRDESEVFQALAQLDLSAQAHQPCGQMSEGQRKRVALARLILATAPLWLLDEAFSALDQSGRDRLSTICRNHIERGGALVFSSHQAVEQMTVDQTLQLGRT